MLKKLSVAIAVASSVAFSSMAVSETVESPIGNLDVSMTATLASDWLDRGRTFNGAPTIQGSLDIAHESGLYVGVWGGSMSESDGGSEFDYYVGYAGSITDDISYDVAVATYTYPGSYVYDEDGTSKDLKNEIEYLASLSAYGATIGVKNRTKENNQFYTYAGYTLELPAGFALAASVGFTDFDEEIKDEQENYMDWSLGVSKPLGGVTLALTYGSTDIEKQQCVAHSCADNFVFSASKTF